MDPINRNRPIQNTMRDTSTHVKKAVGGAKQIIEETYVSHSENKHSFKKLERDASDLGRFFR